jgi:hypothetical protein
MGFKFLRGESLTLQPNNHFLSTNNHLILRRTENRNDFEFCFQFDHEEAIVMGEGPNDLHIHISPTQHGNIEFRNNGRRFKIFAREKE